ncbi:S-layer homology domain-containing protein [Paenibacillus sp. PL91]|uniref:S-layer homology domain-containing protein n=1 Tax=Paenibacillus sp. PL91 TaxID=2729538 RepID=UPI00145EAE9F|nr:S-layer homology domain-containing protein [Paenibacillus sp. PL91]MBC9202791.1 S-layer homology domain-containing protein [Paenibacillus sp. PL91]
MSKKHSLWIKATCMVLSLLVGVSGLLPSFSEHVSAAERVAHMIFSDGFESESPFANWTQEGDGSAAGISNSALRSGLASVKLDQTDALRVSVSTSVYEDISFSYYYKTGSNYAGSLTVEYSVDGGTQWESLDVIQASKGSFTLKQYELPPPAERLDDLRIRFVSNDSGTNAVYIDDIEMIGHVITEPNEQPEPTGPTMEIYSETFDDPDNFGSEGGVVVPHPWLQEGDRSEAKTSVSSSAPSTPNRVKIDSRDSMALPLIATGYGNLTLSYYTTASSYGSGSIMAEWSGNGGTTWNVLEEFKLPPDPNKQGKQENTKKTWTLDSSANNNPNVKFRFRVGDAMNANMYIDSVVISGQRIEGIEPVPTPVPMPDPVETPPFVPPAGVIMHEDVEIGMAGDRKLYTSIAVPEVASAAPMPVLIYIHGGGWNHGDRKSALSTISNYVKNRDYIGVSLSYRLTPEAPFPAQIQDVKLAIRYLRANADKYNIDPSRIGIWGSSAGGHLASLLGTTADLSSSEQITLDNGSRVHVPDLEGAGGYPEYSTRVQAVVDWFGPADFTTEFANNYSSVTKLLGGNKAFTVPDAARLAMPGTYASPDDPPFWIRHGKADLTIPYQDSEKLYAQLRSAHVPIIDFKLVEGQGHGFVGEAKTTADAEAWAFLDEHVKNRPVRAGDPILYKPGLEPNPPKEVVTEIASLLPVDDAAIDSLNADVNYNDRTGGTAGLFSVATSNDRQRYVYFKYDVAEAASPDYKYTLNISAKRGSSGSDVELSLYGLDDVSWSETELTWNNAPAKSLIPSSVLGKFTVNASTTQLYEVDVTDYVRSRLPNGKVAFMVGDAGNTGVSLNLYTKETTSSSNPKPKLVVEQVVDYSNDMEPPAWPINSSLSAANIGTDFVDLRWPAATDNTVVSHYIVYRDNIHLGTVQGTQYKAEGLTSATAYKFTVEAVDVAGHHGAPLVLSRTTLAEPISPIPVAGVTASGSDGNPEYNAVDNNLYTRWSAPGAGQWIQFDLGALKQVGYIGIAFYKGDVRSTQIEIATSTDGITWTPRHAAASSGKTIQMQAFDFADAEARFVRITGNGNSDGSLFTSLTEIQMYPPFENGDTPVAVIPNKEPSRPDDAVPFTQPGMREAGGAEHQVHTPHATTGKVWSVLDFGADPADNGSDDRLAIQAAIDAAGAGDEVFLPHGVYNLNTSPDGFTNLILKSEVNFRGESEAGTILRTSLNQVKNSVVLKASNVHDIVISGLTLTSTWNGQYSTDHQTNNPSAGGPDNQIVISNFGENPSYNITIDHVTVEKYVRMGVRIDSSHDIVVRGSTFRNATDVGGGGAGYGVSIQGVAKVDRLGFPNDTIWNLVEDSTFEGPYLRHGVLIQFVAHNNVVRNNRFDLSKLDAIDLHGEWEYLNEIHGNLITNIETGAGIALGNTGGTAPSNHSKSGPGNYIHDNTIRNAREGIKVHMGTPDTVIERNIIEETKEMEGATGIMVMNGPRTIIRDNIVRNNTAPNYWGIILEHDFGDQNAGNDGEGDPHQIKLLRNKVIGNTNGIHLKAGTEIALRGNVWDNLGTNYLIAEGVDALEEALDSNADLSSLSVSAGSLSPSFASDLTAYTVNLDHAVTSLNIAFSTADASAAVRVNGAPITGGTYPVTGLQAGESVIQLEVTAENGAKKTYALHLNRAAASVQDGNSGGMNNSNDVVSSGSKLTAQVSTVNGKLAATAQVDESALGQIMLSIQNGVVPLVIDTPASAKPDQISVSLNSKALQQLVKNDKAAILRITTQLGTYDLPVKELKLSDWAESLDTSQDLLSFAITLQSSVERADQATQEGQRVLGAIDFTLMVTTADHKSMEINQFSLYVPRTVHLSHEADEGKLAAVRVSVGENGKLIYEPIPFTVVGLEATIYSRTNSTYMLLEKDVSFDDIQKHWAKREIERMANKFIVQGAAIEEFRPEQAITRSEFVALIVRALGLDQAHSAETDFGDVSSNGWYRPYVNAAVEAGIVTGYDDHSYRPHQVVSREEMAVFIYRAMKFADYVPAGAAVPGISFHDANLIEDWAQEAVREMTAQGILLGVEEGQFDPNGSATRAQSAVIVSRMLDKLFIK